MKAYSEDLRERVVRAVAIGTPRDEVAATFGVSVPTIKRWLRLKRETGGLAPEADPGAGGGQEGRVGGGAARRGWGEHADATLGGALLLVARSDRGAGEHGDDESGDHAGLGGPGKKDAERERARRGRPGGLAGGVGAIRREALVFLDETGSHLGYRPTHARAPRGAARVRGRAAQPRGEQDVVTALTLAGIGPLMRFDGAMSTAGFEAYVGPSWRRRSGPARSWSWTT